MKSSKHHDVLGSEYLGVLCRYLREEGELACLCLVSALVIQPVLLCSVLRRFVHATGCGKPLFVIIIIIIIIIINLKRLLVGKLISNRRTATHVIKVEIFRSITSSGLYMEYTREKQVVV